MARRSHARWTACLVFAITTVGAAQADEPDYAGMLLKNQSLLASPPKTCDDKAASLNTFEMEQCSAVAFTAADKALNQAYAAALKDQTPTRTERLRQAQRLWLAYRNVECDWEQLAYEGGTLAPVVMGHCLVDITRARAQQLRDTAGP